MGDVNWDAFTSDHAILSFLPTTTIMDVLGVQLAKSPFGTFPH